MIRVGCFNIAHGRGPVRGSRNWDGGDKAVKLQRLKEIAQVLKDSRLDVVVLNEADFSSFWSGHVDQARLIAREAGYRYFVEQRNIDVAVPFMKLRFGNAILSKYPLSDALFLDYPHPSRLQEFLVGGFKDGAAATVTLPDGRQIQVVAVHLSLEGETYRTASVEIFMDVQKKSRLPMIALGDYNSTMKEFPGYSSDKTGQNCIETLINDENWSTLPKGPPAQPDDFTFPSQESKRVIDWIFVSSPLSIQEKTVLKSDLSDHLPVIADININISAGEMD
jgi:endonuclease/exonuclease/phosphatase family metal-dependent hydrolase